MWLYRNKLVWSFWKKILCNIYHYFTYLPVRCYTLILLKLLQCLCKLMTVQFVLMIEILNHINSMVIAVVWRYLRTEVFDLQESDVVIVFNKVVNSWFSFFRKLFSTSSGCTLSFNLFQSGVSFLMFSGGIKKQYRTVIG